MRAEPAAPALPRALGRWAIAGLMVNAVIGSSVFGLPSVLAGKLGVDAPLAWLVAAAGIGLIIACFAEVSSRFDEAGGAYLYARAAFGPLAGLIMAWMSYLTRLTAAATNANLLVIYLGEFRPGLSGSLPGYLVLSGIIGGLALLNIRGVRAGSAASASFAIGKLVPLGLFLLAGAVIAGPATISTAPTAPPALATWADALLLLMFAYGGFEAALFPLGEAKSPRQDAPRALFGILGLTMVLYTAVQWIVLRQVGSAAVERPLAEAARQLVGPAGATVMVLAAVISVLGYLAGAMVNVPRLTWAMARRGELPMALGAIHHRHRTPWVSILLFALLVTGLAVSGSFLQNLTLSAVSRLLTYGMVSVALLVFRQREGAGRAMGAVSAAALRLPAGRLIAVAAILVALTLATRMTRREGLVVGGVLLLSLLNWLVVRRHRETDTLTPEA